MTDTKSNLRAAMKAQLLAQSPQARIHRSLIIEKKLWSLLEFQKSKMIGFYFSMPEEVNTHGMIDRALGEGRHVAVPKADLKSKSMRFYEIRDRVKDLEEGPYGIFEPMVERTREIKIAELDCILVPGVVFDQKLSRIGHGAGFYDRFLAGSGTGTKKIALAYSFQVSQQDIPVEKYDIKIDLLITD